MRDYSKQKKRKEKDIKGEVFGFLTAIKRTSEVKKNVPVKWLFKCACGNKKEILKYYVLNGVSKSCGCQTTDLRYDSLKKQGKKLSQGEASFNILLREYKAAAKQRKIDFKLKKEEFKKLTKENCFYCNIEPKQIRKNNAVTETYVYNGVDRLDSSIGYTKKNCVACCKRCNFAKSNSSLEEFLDWISRFKNFDADCLLKKILSI